MLKSCHTSANRKEYQSDTHSDTILVACEYCITRVLQEYYERIEYCHPTWQQATRTGEQEELCKLADKMPQTKENFSNPRLQCVQCVYLNKKECHKGRSCCSSLIDSQIDFTSEFRADSCTTAGSSNRPQPGSSA